jgi:hypothetical protein
MVKHKKPKQKYIRNDIVFDPNISIPDFLDYDFESNKAAKKQYLKGKKKRKKYFGI